MTENELKNDYFEWICQLVCGEHYSQLTGICDYRELLKYLHRTEFSYILPMDMNRQSDGIDLRYQYGYENSIDDRMIACYIDTKPCSVLEMMAALAKRCEDDIMHDSDFGDRTSQWFLYMIESLGLSDMMDDNYDPYLVENVVNRFLARKYKKDGKGGLFYIPGCKKDMRNAEIWYQMNWYINTIN